jgi:ABC-type multidrug transport system ATPase subunit
MAVLGPNGVGKTTVLKLIAGLLRPDQGTVTVDGKEPGVATTHDVSCVLADERSFHWRLDLDANMDFFIDLAGLDRREAKVRLAYLFDRLDLEEYRKAPFGSLSTGTKQRLGVARALLTRPRVLLMDEPTRSIDIAHASEIWRLVREEIDEVGGCVMLVTHNVQEALSLCDRIAILSEGKIALEASTEYLQTSAQDLDGFTIAVRGLSRSDLGTLRQFPGIREIQVVSVVGGEQTLEVATDDGQLSLAGFLSALTSTGAIMCSLQRTTPLQSVLERLISEPAPLEVSA